MRPAKLELGVNPIIVKELRSRMRGGRAFATLTGVLLILAAISYALFQMVLATSRYSTTPLSPMIGQTLFAGLALLELIMVCGVTPAVTAGAISGERERETYEMLLATPLRPASVLWGKLISALGYVFLLVFAAVPMASLVFIFGGVAPREMLKALLILIVLAVLFGVIGLFFSALLGRTGRATVVTYLVVFALLFGPGFLAVALGVINQAEPPRWVLVPSPINAMFSALAPSFSSEIGSIFYLLGGNFWFNTGQVFSQTAIPRPLYHYSLPLYGLVILVLYMVTTRLVLPARRWQISWKEAGIALGLVSLLVGITAFTYWRTSDRYENFTDLQQQTPPSRVTGGGMAVAVPAVEVAVQAPPPTPTPLPAESAAGPTAEPYPVPGAVAEAPGDDAVMQANIYAAVIDHFLAENPFPEALQDLQALYLLDETNDTLDLLPGEFTALPAEAISEQAQVLIGFNLQDLGVELRWVTSLKEIDPASAEPGPVFLLGNIQTLPDGRVGVPAVLVVQDEGRVERLYTLETQDEPDLQEQWRVVDYQEAIEETAP